MFLINNRRKIKAIPLYKVIKRFSKIRQFSQALTKMLGNKSNYSTRLPPPKNTPNSGENSDQKVPEASEEKSQFGQDFFPENPNQVINDYHLPTSFGTTASLHDSNVKRDILLDQNRKLFEEEQKKIAAEKETLKQKLFEKEEQT